MRESLADVQKQSDNYYASYLQDGGEMGKRTREHEWATTSIGIPQQWPLSLLTTLGILLHSKFPMFLFWGPEHLCFYNDAYRPSLGNNGKHPHALGKKGEDVWPEIWSDIKPLIDDVLSGKGGTWNENNLLPIFRNGEMEDVFWTFSYSPVIGETGKPTGVFVTCVETTERINNSRKVEQSEQRVRAVVESAPFPIGVYVGKEMRIELANQTMLDTWGKGDNVKGKLYSEVLPELDNQDIFNQLDNVFTTGVPFHAKNQRVDLVVSGKLQPFYFNYSFTPLFDSLGKVYGVMNTAADVTDLNVAKQKVEESERNFRNLVMQAPVGICIVGGDPLNVEVVNDTFLGLVGKQREEFEEHRYWDVLPQLSSYYAPILEHVFETGIAFRGQEHPILLAKNGREEMAHISFVYDPIKEIGGTVKKVMILAIDVTEQVLTRKKVEEAEEKTRLAISSSGLGVYEIAYTSNEMTTDARFNEIWGFNRPVAREEYAAAIHPNDLFIRDQAHAVSLQSGRLEYEARVIWKNKSLHWVRVKGKVLFDDDGKPTKLIGVVQDITDQVIAQKKIEESEKNIRDMVVHAPVAMCIFRGPTYVVEIANKKMFELWGKEEVDVIGKPIFEGLPEAREQGLEQLLLNVFVNGERFVANERPVSLPRNGKIETVYINFVYEAQKEGDGTISGILAVAVDVTPQVIARQKIEVAEERARLAINAAELGVFEIDLTANKVVTDVRFEEIFELAEAPTWRQIISTIHPEDLGIREKAHQAALETGMLNYEARIIKKDRSIGWIRGKGIVSYDDKNKPSKILGVIQDITEQKLFAEALEKKVHERTKELAEANLQLQQSNIELNQFAYIASHDLQEPLRKVRTFTELMQASLGQVPEKAENYIRKIQSSAERMQTLINDVLKFSLLSKERENFENVNLNEILKNVLGDYELLIEQKQAKVSAGVLPVIEAIPLQMSQLFTNLISNALKFSSKDRLLTIVISSTRMAKEEVEQYKELNEDKVHYLIEFKDNGIGFSQEYSKQIFTIFQRLHSKMEYAGTGIGLAMCKKITVNHHGTIYAISTPNEGSSFMIILPEVQNKVDEKDVINSFA